MLAAYSSRRRLAARLRKALDGSVSAHVSTEWDTFRERARSAECACVALPGLDPQETARGLARLRSRYPALPLILLSPKRAEALRRVSRLRVEEVVWLAGLESELHPALRRARQRPCLLELSARISEAGHFPARLRRALELACRSDPPLRSVSELLPLMGRSRSTLNRQWHKAVGVSEKGLTGPKAFLCWLQLLWALRHKTPEESWGEVGRRLGIDRKTLDRRARNLTGSSLAELETAAEPAVLDSFRESAEAALVGPPDGPN